MPIETEDVVGRLLDRTQVRQDVEDEAADLIQSLSERIDVLEGALRACFNIACDYTIEERQARSEIASQARTSLTEGIAPNVRSV